MAEAHRLHARPARELIAETYGRAPAVMVPLRDLSVSLAALQLLWALEARGLSLTVTDDGLRVSPGRRLLSTDQAAGIRQHREELLALVKYCEVIQ